MFDEDADSQDESVDAQAENDEDTSETTEESTPELKRYKFNEESPDGENGYIDPTWYDEDGKEVDFDIDVDDVLDMVEGETLPDKYNLDDYNLVRKEVENQASTGTCWAHGSLAAAESNMIVKGYEDTTVNLSEAHLAWFALAAASTDKNDPLYGDSINVGKRAYNNGGNFYRSMSALSAGIGTLYEKEMTDISTIDSSMINPDDPDPENPDNPNPEQYPDLSKYESLRYHSDYLMVNGNMYNGQNTSQRNLIKSQLKTTGAMQISYASYKNCVNYEDGKEKYYYVPISKNTNHCITLVGWDDTIPKEKFTMDFSEYGGDIYTPSIDGGWLVRNSWGDSYGDDGYFYISYDDQSLGIIASVEVEPRDKYGDTIYQYAGNVNSSFGNKSYGAGAGIIFTADSAAPLTSFGIFNFNANTPYEATIYENAEYGKTPDSGKEIYSCSGTFEKAGYHIVDFDEPIAVEEGKTYSIFVKMLKNNSAIICDSHSYKSGASYFALLDSSTGDVTKWFDTSEVDEPCDIQVRVYTQAQVVQATPAPGLYFEEQEVTLSTKDEDATIYYTVDGSDPKTGTKYAGEKIKISAPETDTPGDSKVTVIKAVVEGGSDDGKTASFTYEVYNRPALKSVGSVEDIKDVASGTSLENIAKLLPTEVAITTEGDLFKTASISWDTSKFAEGSYDPKNNAPQTFKYAGTVVLPNKVKAGDVSLKVVISVSVKQGKYTLTFDANGGKVIGNETLLFAKDEEIKGLPIAYIPGKEFTGWYTETGIQVKENDKYTFDKDITLKASYSNVTLVVGQKYNASPYINSLNLDRTKIYYVKAKKLKYKPDKVTKTSYFLATKKGDAWFALYEKVGKKYVEVEGTRLNITVNKIKAGKISASVGQTGIYASAFVDNIPSEYYNTITWSIKNPKKKTVATINQTTGELNILEKGSATVELTLTRDGISKTFKIKLKVK